MELRAGSEMISRGGVRRVLYNGCERREHGGQTDTISILAQGEVLTKPSRNEIASSTIATTSVPLQLKTTLLCGVEAMV